MRIFAFAILAVLYFGNVQAGWFGTDHYYVVGTKSKEQFYCKGEPFEKDGFLIFTQWPDKKEWRLKKELVIWVKDTGTLSPEEIKAKEAHLKQEREYKLRALFAISEKTHNPHFVPQTLAEARKIADDYEIKHVLSNLNCKFKFKGTLNAGFSLDEIAKSFKDEDEDIFDLVLHERKHDQGADTISKPTTNR
jgi:hypothetical protein